MTSHLEKVAAHVRARILPTRGKIKSMSDLLKLYKRFIKIEERRIQMLHKAGGDGLMVAGQRSDLLDVVLQNILTDIIALENKGEIPTQAIKGFNLVATGGYGRALLNPKSDIDLLFLFPGKTTSLPTAISTLLEHLLAMLWDVGFKVGHAVRSIKECVHHANQDNLTKTALLESRLILGDEVLFKKLMDTFRKKCLDGQEDAYIRTRLQDQKQRHAKYGNTVFLQEPHVKNGVGGLRDYQNPLWIAMVRDRIGRYSTLHRKGMISLSALREINKAYTFLHRVRNELHRLDGGSSDILTLRNQGVIARAFNYPQRTILRQIEAFMRDYYTHTRNLAQHTAELLETWEIQQEAKQKEKPKGGLKKLVQLALKTKSEEPNSPPFDGFVLKNNRLYLDSPSAFEEDSSRMMRAFQYAQIHEVKFSPELAAQITALFPLINKSFRYHHSIRETFWAILSRVGKVATTLRAMHRLGFLGRYLPEFGALTCLVQHEFFHRYTADEHTLTCIDRLDELVNSEDPSLAFYRDLFRKVEEPAALYLALLLHDSGRAANTRTHTNASAELTLQVCRRLKIQGETRRLILFLVDNHLILWHTATTKNIEDPEVIREFAGIVKSKSYLDTLLVLTYADAKGTSEQSWNGWKESLIRRLHAVTSTYFSDPATYEKEARIDLDHLKAQVMKELPESYEAEVNAHFEGMPRHYFNFRDPHEIVKHLRLFREFFKFLSTEKSPTLMPIIKWTTRPEIGCNELYIVSWDRHLLLAKIAGLLAANNLNIISADLYQRSDDVVLDIFHVATSNFQPVTSERVFQRFSEMAEKVFSEPEFDLNLLLQSNRPYLKTPQDERERTGVDVPKRALINNRENPEHTLVQIQTSDRVGLLYDLFRAIGECDLDVRHARINTEKGAAIDTLYLQTRTGQKITDPEALKKLQGRIDQAIL